VVKIERISPPPLDVAIPSQGASPAISADGRFVLFQFQDIDVNTGVFLWEIYLQDRQTGETERVGNGRSAAMSAEGCFVAFVSTAADLVPGETHPGGGTYVWDHQSRKPAWVAPGEGLALSADGRFVAFASTAHLDPQRSPAPPAVGVGALVPSVMIYVWDRQTGKTELVTATSAGHGARGLSSFPAISADGRFIAFTSDADELVPSDANKLPDSYVWDGQTRQTESVSVSALGDLANGSSGAPTISADGRFVAFASGADNVVPGDTNGRTDVFVAERG
jgi:Tol biopolymer transport system component